MIEIRLACSSCRCGIASSMWMYGEAAQYIDDAKLNGWRFSDGETLCPLCAPRAIRAEEEIEP